jgi:hypothetical protein
MQSHGHAATDKAARYMTQLAKHWSHKFEVEFDAQHARIVLPLGTCRMTAGPDALDLVLDAPDADTLPRFEQVVADHLNRFAFREPELAVTWTRDQA